MKILFFLDYPIPTESQVKIYDGYTLRTHNLSKFLRNINHQILIAYIQEGNVNKYLQNDLVDSVKPISFEYFNKIQGKFYKFFICYFRLLIKYKPQELKSFHKELEKIIKINNIDLIHVQGHFAGLSLIGLHEVPKLLDLTDSMTLYFKRRIKVEKKLGDRLNESFISNWYKNIERTLLKNYKVVTVVSEKDRLELKSIYKYASIQVIPNGVDTDFFHPFSQKEYNPSIFFHGTMHFEPNVNAVMYIYNQVLPFIRKEIPNLKFFIIGSDPTPDIMKFNDGKNVIVTGEVDDIRNYISKCNIALMPMKSGSGIKNKILEAMAMEKPVVTNTMGAEAFDEETQNTLLIGENEEEIAQYVIKLLKNPQIRQNIGKKSRIMAKKYSWDETTQEYEKLYKKLIDEDI